MNDNRPWRVYDLETFWVQMACLIRLCPSLRMQAQQGYGVDELLKYVGIVQQEPRLCDYFVAKQQPPLPLQ